MSISLIGFVARLSDEQLENMAQVAIRSASNPNYELLGRQFGVSGTAIRDVVKRRRWASV